MLTIKSQYIYKLPHGFFKMIRYSAAKELTKTYRVSHLLTQIIE